MTGGSRGIGSAIAYLLGKSNAVTIVNYKTNKQSAEEVCNLISSNGGKAYAFQCDVTVPEQVETMFGEIGKKFGNIQLLVNCAGARLDALTHSMKADEWEDCIRVNLSSVFYVTKEAIKQMLKIKFGRIVSVSSVAGTVGSFGQSNYSAAKAGIVGLMKSIAVEYARKNIRANTVIPGIIETDMTSNLRDDVVESLKSQIPVRRFGKPEEVAYPVCFLLSEAASYINGATLHINGGGLRL